MTIHTPSPSTASSLLADQAIELSRILGEFGAILRVTKLPNGDPESDSHHSFSLALIAFDIASKHAPELDAHKMVMYALVHDLLEIVTGDENTLFSKADDHSRKRTKEQEAIIQLQERLADYPELLGYLHDYEQRKDAEAVSVYWLDKATTVWTHFPDNGANLRALGIANRAQIDQWYENLLVKLKHNSALDPPQIIKDVLHNSYLRMRNELLED